MTVDSLNHTCAQESLMENLIKGRIHDEKNSPLEGIRVKAYDEDSIFDDDSLEYDDTKNGKIFEITFDSGAYNNIRTMERIDTF